jgi:hypothetical protein
MKVSKVLLDGQVAINFNYFVNLASYFVTNNEEILP